MIGAAFLPAVPEAWPSGPRGLHLPACSAGRAGRQGERGPGPARRRRCRCGCGSTAGARPSPPCTSRCPCAAPGPPPPTSSAASGTWRWAAAPLASRASCGAGPRPRGWSNPAQRHARRAPWQHAECILSLLPFIFYYRSLCVPQAVKRPSCGR